MDAIREYHHGHLREACLREALGLLETGGVDGLTLRGLARATGVSHTAIGKEFGGLPAFFAALAAEIYVRLDVALREASCGVPEPLPAFREMGRAYVLFSIDHPAWLQFLGHPAVLEAAWDPGLQEASRRPHLALLELVIRCMDAGCIRAAPPERVALLVWSTVHGFGVITSWGRPELLGGRTRAEWADTLLDDLYFGLLPLPEPSGAN